MGSNSPLDYSLIVIDTSAGGLEALLELARGLLVSIAAALCVLVHFLVDATSHLPHILNQGSRLHAQHAQDCQCLGPGCFLVAAPDHHLLVADSELHLTPEPRANGVRPATDHLFRTGALTFGPRTIGTLHDGVDGLRVIKAHGNLAVVQDPAEALFDTTPRTALESVAVDGDLPQPRLGPNVAGLVVPRASMPPVENRRNETVRDLLRWPVAVRVSE